jgi:hypothetical protein
MAANTQLASVRRASSPSDRPILPKWSTPLSRTESNTQAAPSPTKNMALPILVIGLSAALTLAWTFFLVWKAAASVLGMLM